MALDRKARGISLIAAIVLIAGALAFLLDQRGSEPGTLPRPFGTRVDLRTPRDSVTRDAPELSEVRAAVLRLEETLSKEPLAAEDWHEAEREAQDIVQLWVAFKAPMRASAGERMWSTSDVNRFDQLVRDARTQVRERDAERARKSVADMQALIDKYDGTGGAAVQRTAGD